MANKEYYLQTQRRLREATRLWGILWGKMFSHYQNFDSTHWSSSTHSGHSLNMPLGFFEIKSNSSKLLDLSK